MPDPIKLYPGYIESTCIGRKNRFTLTVSIKGIKTDVYLPNTGRLEEHLLPGNKIFLTGVKTRKFEFRAISTVYKDSFVLLDTQRVNDILISLIKSGKIMFFDDIKKITSEHRIKNRRFDLFIESMDLRNGKNKGSLKNIVEIKTCTLCHRGVAMFPDAPSIRAAEHILMLSELQQAGFKSWFIFLVLNSKARYFIPNFHTDKKFASILMNNRNINYRALKVPLIDPVTVDIDAVEEIPVRYDLAAENLTEKGSYLMVLFNDRNRKIEVGKLGTVHFKPGYYVYVGSALNNLDSRIKRHMRKSKKYHWHIDYITPEPLKISRIYKFRRIDRIEEKMAKKIRDISDGAVKNFGSSDVGEQSHLFFFLNNPSQKREFIDVVLDFLTLTD